MDLTVLALVCLFKPPKQLRLSYGTSGLSTMYSHFRNYAPPPLDVKGGIITEKVFPVFSEFFWTCFGLVMYIWELMGVTEKFAFQM